MRQVTRKGLITVAAATGVLAVTGGYAHADSGAYGSAAGSPGVLSGNSVQVPVHVPVNVCGNTVNVVGLLNPTAGNSCANRGGGSHTGGGGGGGSQAGGHTGGSPGVGSGNTVQAPVDVPVNVCGNTANVGGLGNGAGGNDCANAPGGDRTTPPGGGHRTPPPGGGGHHTPPGGGHHTPPGGEGGTTPPGGRGATTPPGTPAQPGHPGNPQHPGRRGGFSHANHPGAQSLSQPLGTAQLAHTGSDLPLGMLVPTGAGALLGGALLYRRARASV